MFYPYQGINWSHWKNSQIFLSQSSKHNREISIKYKSQLRIEMVNIRQLYLHMVTISSQKLRVAGEGEEVKMESKEGVRRTALGT